MGEMSFQRGDRVHLPGLGTGVVLEARGKDRYAIELKGRVVVANVADIEAAPESGKSRGRNDRSDSARTDDATSPARAARSIDLHGKTVAEARNILEEFISNALLDGYHEAHVIHGRSGGRVKAAVHQYLRSVAAVRTFRVDPRNSGVTIVIFA